MELYVQLFLSYCAIIITTKEILTPFLSLTDVIVFLYNYPTVPLTPF